MIGRHNYEIWFTDYLDGKLTSEQQSELFTFLAENPDFDNELKDMSTEIPQIVHAYEVPDLSLKKKIVAVHNLTENNYEEAFIAFHEGDLDEEGKNYLNDFLARNSFLISELNYFGKITITHNGEMYPKKDKLRKSPIVIPMFRYAAAASVIVLLGMGILKIINNNGQVEGEMATSSIPGLHRPSIKNYTAENKTQPVNTPNITKVDSVQLVEFPVKNDNMASLELVNPSLIDNINKQQFSIASSQELILINQKDDAQSFAQIVGKVIENGIGENDLSDGLQNKEKLTGGDMADVAVLAFKNTSDPLLVTTGNKAAGNRRMRFTLGVFEADFALK